MGATFSRRQGVNYLHWLSLLMISQLQTTSNRMSLINGETCWIRVSAAFMSAKMCWKWLLIIEIVFDIFLHLLWTSHCSSKGLFLTLHTSYTLMSQWRQNGRNGVSYHQPHDCLLNRLFRRRSKKTSKLRVISLSAGNSPVTSEFPAQRANSAENVSIWWRFLVGEEGSGKVYSFIFTDNTSYNICKFELYLLLYPWPLEYY